MTDTEFEQRDEQVAAALEAGRSLRVVRREFSLTETELDAALTRLWPIDQQARLRLIRRDVCKLDRLLDVFYGKGLQGDVNSATVAVRIWERLHALVGLEAAQRVDLTIAPQEAPSSFDKAYEVVMRLARSGRQSNGQPNDGAGAVGALSVFDDKEPNR